MNTLKQKICFIHVAKCAGTSFIASIRKSYPLRQRLLQPASFVTINASASLKGSQIFEEGLWSYRERLLIYFLSNESNKFVAGHFPLSERVLKNFIDEWRFITIIRNPVDRWFSHYFFNRYKMNTHFKTDLSLDQYIDSADGQFIGSLYHMVFGGSVWSKNHCLEESCNEAISTIKKMHCIGVVEDLGKFIEDFKKFFGVKLVSHEKNRNPLTSLERAKLETDAIRNKVEKICEPDMKIYNYVLEMIHSK